VSPGGNGDRSDCRGTAADGRRWPKSIFLGSANPYDLCGDTTGYFESGSLDVVIVTEPSAWLLAGLGLAAAGWAARRFVC
jgi:hypothetical protein